MCAAGAAAYAVHLARYNVAAHRSFKGFGPTMLSGAPYTGIQMTTYEVIKRSGPSNGDGVFWQLVPIVKASISVPRAMSCFKG
jgi:hypothetical protein